MTAPASIRLEELNKAKRIYDEFHSGPRYISYLIILTLLILSLLIRSILQLARVLPFSESAATEVGMVATFTAILIECAWLHSQARREEIKMWNYENFRVDFGLGMYALLIYLIAFKAGKEILGVCMHIFLLLPLLVRSGVVARGIQRGGGEAIQTEA